MNDKTRKYIEAVTCKRYRVYGDADAAFSAIYDTTKRRAANGDAKALLEREAAMVAFNAAIAAADTAFNEGMTATE